MAVHARHSRKVIRTTCNRSRTAGGKAAIRPDRSYHDVVWRSISKAISAGWQIVACHGRSKTQRAASTGSKRAPDAFHSLQICHDGGLAQLATSCAVDVMVLRASRPLSLSERIESKPACNAAQPSYDTMASQVHRSCALSCYNSSCGSAHADKRDVALIGRARVKSASCCLRL